jgi:hypothetical protein
MSEEQVTEYAKIILAVLKRERATQKGPAPKRLGSGYLKKLVYMELVGKPSYRTIPYAKFRKAVAEGKNLVVQEVKKVFALACYCEALNRLSQGKLILLEKTAKRNSVNLYTLETPITIKRNVHSVRCVPMEFYISLAEL